MIRCVLRCSLVLLLLSLFSFSQGTSFTLIAMPDVQNESQYYPQVLNAETQWIANSQAALNIQGVLGLGDIVNNGSSATQWSNADAAYKLLDQAGIPYFLAIGNHDYDNANPSTRATTGFDQWFGPARFANRSWYSGNYNSSNANFYGTLTLNGQSYLILVMEYVPRDQAVTWASSILSANQDKHVILITHSFLYSDNTRVDQCDTLDMNSDNYGEKLWTKLVSQYPNIELVLSGHVTSGLAARRADLGINGNLVNQLFSNYQTLANGGDGFLRILTFHPDTDSISVQTYSPYLNAYKTDTANQFTIPWHVHGTTATTGSVSGLVRDAGTCKRIPGAQVAVGSQTATSDSNGHYALTEPQGNYSLAVTASNYNSATLSTSVNNGFDSEADAFLVPNPSASCTLNSASPSVTICTPAQGASVTSPVSVTAGTTDSAVVSYVQLYADGSSITTQRGGTLNTSVTLAAGTHHLTVQAKDANGAIFKQSVDVTVGATSSPTCTLSSTIPSVTICSPANNATVSSPVTINGATHDDTTLSFIQLYVDGVAKVTQSGGTFKYSLSLATGTHRLTLQAKDAKARIFKQSVSVTVK